MAFGPDLEYDISNSTPQPPEGVLDGTSAQIQVWTVFRPRVQTLLVEHIYPTHGQFADWEMGTARPSVMAVLAARPPKKAAVTTIRQATAAPVVAPSITATNASEITKLGLTGTSLWKSPTGAIVGGVIENKAGAKTDASYSINAAGLINYNLHSGDPGAASSFETTLAGAEANYAANNAPGTVLGPGLIGLVGPASPALAASAPAPAAPSAAVAAAPGAVAATPAATTLSALQAAIAGTPAVSGTTDPVAAAANSLLNTGTNAYNSAGGGSDESGTGPPSSVAGLDALQPVASTDTAAAASGGSSSYEGFIVIAIVALLVGVGFWYWRKHHAKQAA